MPYLSRIRINPLRRGAQRLMASPHRLHAAVLGGLAAQPVIERILWRLETRTHEADLVVLTQSQPSWIHLIEQAGWPGAEGGSAEVHPYEPLLALISKGRQFSFRARLNPKSSCLTPSNPTPSQERKLSEQRRRGVRLGHRTAAHQLDWFLDRAAGATQRWGFTVGSLEAPHVEIVQREKVMFTKGAGSGLRVTLDVATYQGHLEVTDAALLRETVLAGIGGGKAYGCGLLTLGPVG